MPLDSQTYQDLKAKPLLDNTNIMQPEVGEGLRRPADNDLTLSDAHQVGSYGGVLLEEVPIKTIGEPTCLHPMVRARKSGAE